MDPKDRAARRDRLRARAVTTTVVATVVAAPVLALWAAYRGTPTGEGVDGHSAGASQAQGPGSLDGAAAGGGYENAGNASPDQGDRFGSRDKPEVSVEVIGVSGAAGRGAGLLEVSAGNSGDTTLVTLTATGRATVRWSASTGAHWLYLSRSAGTLAPGESLTIKVYVDHLREPSGRWSARVAISPAGAVVSIEGYGTAPGPSGPGHGPGPAPDPYPTDPTDPTDPGEPTDPTDPTGPGTPSDPPPSSSEPDPTPPTTPAPTDPRPSEPPSSPEPSPTAGDPSAPGPSGPSDPGGSPPAGGSGEPSPSTY